MTQFIYNLIIYALLKFKKKTPGVVQGASNLSSLIGISKTMKDTDLVDGNKVAHLFVTDVKKTKVAKRRVAIYTFCVSNSTLF